MVHGSPAITPSLTPHSQNGFGDRASLLPPRDCRYAAAGELSRAIEYLQQKMKEMDRRKRELEQSQSLLARMLDNKLALLEKKGELPGFNVHTHTNEVE